MPNQANHPLAKPIAEFIGTFFLVLTIGCTVIPGSPGVIPPLAIAAMLMTMIYAFGHISGGHFNPGVTLAVVLRGKCPPRDGVAYVVAQLAGAALAALVVGVLVGYPSAPMAIKDVKAALLAEFLFSFALASVVLHVATARGNAGNSFFGVAIAAVVLAGALSVGGISGGAFNSAVALGAGVMKMVAMGDLWIHVVANLAAGAVAGLLFRAMLPDDR
ncbi:MAG: aquaporin [Phycisphaerales bacterium]|jgi:aquaporin Z|nr:aquaporin [Phycisphaerales bacterium]